MSVSEMLEEMRLKAVEDPELRCALIATHESDRPLANFCKICRSEGYEVYPMDVIDAGEEFYASYRRSTNGGGENAPKLAGQDDFYEMFIDAMKAVDAREQGNV